MRFVVRSYAMVLLACGAFCARPATAAAAEIEQQVAACAACHGKQGRSDTETYYPSIAGKPAGYLYNQLKNFQQGRRHNKIMEQMLAYLSDAYLHKMADYYAAQYPVAWTSEAGKSPEELARGRKLVEVGDAARKLPACISCHSADLGGAAPYIPGLRGLRSDYLAAQLGSWRNQIRKAAEPDCMADLATRLTGEEIAAVTAWLASQPAMTRHALPQKSSSELPMPCGVVK